MVTSPPGVEPSNGALIVGVVFGGDAHAPASKEMIWVESGTVTLTVAGRGYQVDTGECGEPPEQRDSTLEVDDRGHRAFAGYRGARVGFQGTGTLPAVKVARVLGAVGRVMITAGTLILLFVGIHNAWDAATWMAVHKRK